MKNTVIIFNPASIDSTVTAALVMDGLIKALSADHDTPNKINKALKNVDVLAASPNIFKKKYEEIYWIGIEPQASTLKFISTDGEVVQHHLLLEGNFEIKQMEGHSFTHLYEQQALQDYYRELHMEDVSDDDMPDSSDLLPPSTLLWRYVLSQKLTINTLWWTLSTIIDKFNKFEKVVSMEDQALLYSAYTSAMLTIHTKTEIQIDTDPVKNVPIYKNYLPILKAEIFRLMSIQAVLMDHKMVNLAVLNINQESVPWAIKLISCTYDSVVTYEQISGRTVYTTFSRLQGFNFDTFLKKQLRPDHPEDMIFSYQL